MKSICFFMVYHGRPELTKMSIDDMNLAMHHFINRGFDVTAVVIGDSPDVEGFCNDMSVTHETFKNDPVADKFTYAWMRAAQQRCDYICWYGSNNVHHAGYWEEAMNTLMFEDVSTLGTTNCLVMSADRDKTEGCIFHPTEGYVISSGQFFRTRDLIKSVNILTVYNRDQTCNFDGVLLDAIKEECGPYALTVVTHCEEDCIDVKNSENIHSFQAYMDMPHYKRYSTRDVVGRHPCLNNFMNGVYAC